MSLSSFVDDGLKNQETCDVETVLRYLIGEKYPDNIASVVVTLTNVIGKSFGETETKPKIELIPVMRTLLAVLKLKCSLEAQGTNNEFDYESEQSLIVATRSLKYMKTLDATSELACRLIHVSLLHSPDSVFKDTLHDIITMCEDALKRYMGVMEIPRTISISPEIALHLLTVVADAMHKIKPKLPVFRDFPFSNMSHELIVQLALCQSTALRAQTLLLLIPKLKELEDSRLIIVELLSAILSCEGEEGTEKALAALCALSTFYFAEGGSTYTVDVSVEISFWKLIQSGLCSDVALTRKYALYILRKFIDAVKTDDKKFCEEWFFWSIIEKERLDKTWQDLCTILEVLEERAFHLISPALDMLESHFVASVGNMEDAISACFLRWIVVIFRVVLRHSCPQVVKWGVETLFGKTGSELIGSSLSMIFHPFILPFTQCLSMSHIFYDTEDDYQDTPDLPKIFGKLETFLVSASQSEHRQILFRELFNVMGTINWAPIPIFAISTSLSKVPPFPCLNPECYPAVQRLVSKVRGTQNVIIRATSLHHLLIAVLNLLDLDSAYPSDILNVFNAFYNDKCIPRGTDVWNQSVKWLFRASQKCKVVSWMDEYAINTDLFSPVFVQFVLMLLDSGALKNLNFLEPSLSLLANCADRPYVDQEAQTRLVELIAYLVEGSRILQPCQSDQDFDTTRRLVLCTVEATSNSIVELMRNRLFCVDNLSACHIAIRLLRCLHLLFDDKDTVKIISGEKHFQTLLNAACEPVINFGIDSQIKYFFAINVVKCASKIVKCKETRRQIYDKVFEASEGIVRAIRKPVLSPNHWIERPSWTTDIEGYISSGICEAQWDVIPEFLTHLCEEDLAYNLLSSLGQALDVGSRDMLPSLCNVLGIVLPKYPQNAEPPLAVLRGFWANILQSRSKEVFHPALTRFLRAIFRPDVLFRFDWNILFAVECGQEVIGLGDSASSIVSELALILQWLIHQEAEKVFLSPVRGLIVACFMFGPILRRDEKLLRKITSSITNQDFPVSSDQVSAKNERIPVSRPAAVEMILFLIDGSAKRKTEIADMLASDLMEQTERPEAKNSRYFANSLTHRIHLRILQGLMLVETANSMEMREKIGKWALKRLLEENHQLSARQVTEWLLVRCLCSLDHLRTEVFNIIENAGDFRESAVCSVVCTLLHTFHSLDTLSPYGKDKVTAAEEFRNFLNRFFVALIPLTMAQAYSMRFVSHVAILQVWEASQRLHLTNEMEKYGIIARAVQSSFGQACNRFQSHNYFYLADFRCEEHYSLETLFYELPRLNSMSSDEWIRPEFLRKVGVREMGSIPLFSKNRRLEQCSPSLNQRRAYTSTDEPSQLGYLQKKMVPAKWLEMNETQIRNLPKPLQPERIQLEGRSYEMPTRGLVVVASLLDKPSNLGGLCRTCEVMGASLAIPKMSYTKHPEFKALSMSSEMWAQIFEVRRIELLNFMFDMKKRGFSIVGAEQTAKSISLSLARFEKNTLLILGNERTGIPAGIIPRIDYCVEIPQHGLVRSLNVHVAGSLVMYEYSRQHSQPPLLSTDKPPQYHF